MNQGASFLKSLNWNLLLQNESECDSDDTCCDVNDIQADLALPCNYKKSNYIDNNGKGTSQTLLESHTDNKLSIGLNLCCEDEFNKNIIRHNCNSLKEEHQVKFETGEGVHCKSRVQIFNAENNEHQTSHSNDINRINKSEIGFVNNSFTDKIETDGCGFNYDLERIQDDCETLHNKEENYLFLSHENQVNTIENATAINIAFGTDEDLIEYPVAINTNSKAMQTDNDFLEGLSHNLEILIEECDALNNFLGLEENPKTRACSPPLTLSCESRRKRLPAQKVLPKYSKKHADTAVARKVLPPRKCASFYNKKGNPCGKNKLILAECADINEIKIESTKDSKLQPTMLMKNGAKQMSKKKNNETILIKPSENKRKTGKRGRKKKTNKNPENQYQEKEENLGELLMRIEEDLVETEKSLERWLSGNDPQPPTREQAFLMLKNTQSAAATLERLLLKNNRNVYKKPNTRNQVKRTRKIMKILLEKSNQMAIMIDKIIAECDRLMNIELQKMFHEEGCGSSQEEYQESKYPPGSSSNSSVEEKCVIYSKQIKTKVQKKPKSILKYSSSENSTENTSEAKHISFSDEVDFCYLSGSNVSSLSADEAPCGLLENIIPEDKTEQEATKPCLFPLSSQTKINYKIDFLQGRPMGYEKEQNKSYSFTEKTPVSTSNIHKTMTPNIVNEPQSTTIKEKDNTKESICSESLKDTLKQDFSLAEENCSVSFGFTEEATMTLNNVYNLTHFLEENLNNVPQAKIGANAKTIFIQDYPQIIKQNLAVEITNKKAIQHETINTIENELEDRLESSQNKKQNEKNYIGPISPIKRQFDCFNPTSNQLETQTSILGTNSNQLGCRSKNCTVDITNNEITENVRFQTKPVNSLRGGVLIQRHTSERNTVIGEQNKLNFDVNADTALSDTSTENGTSFGFSEVLTMQEQPDWTKITIMSIKGVRIKDSAEYNFEADSDGLDGFGDLAMW